MAIYGIRNVGQIGIVIPRIMKRQSTRSVIDVNDTYRIKTEAGLNLLTESGSALRKE